MRLDLVRLYYANNSSATEALRKYKTEKGLKHDPCAASAVTKLIQKSETTFSSYDMPKSGRPSLKEERVNLVSNAVDDSANEIRLTSVRGVSAVPGIPQTSRYRIIRNCLKLYP